MEESAFASGSLAVLALVLAALLCARIITANERRLVTGTSLLLAGVLFCSRVPAPALFGAGAALTVAGAAMMLRATTAWDEESVSGMGMGALAAVIMIPPAFFGAILLVGVILSALAAPARLRERVFGG